MPRTTIPTSQNSHRARCKRAKVEFSAQVEHLKAELTVFGGVFAFSGWFRSCGSYISLELELLRQMATLGSCLHMSRVAKAPSHIAELHLNPGSSLHMPKSMGCPPDVLMLHHTLVADGAIPSSSLETVILSAGGIKGRRRWSVLPAWTERCGFTWKDGAAAEVPCLLVPCVLTVFRKKGVLCAVMLFRVVPSPWTQFVLDVLVAG